MDRRIARITFSKTGDIRFISHLDLMSLFERALRRARVPLWYSEGFNPHPKLNFALPLSVGTESLCEMCDVSVEGDPGAGCFERLGGEFPEGITLNGVSLDPEKKFSQIRFCGYELTFPGGAGRERELEDLLKGGLEVPKRSKKGEIMLAITPLVEEARFCSEGADLKAYLLVCAGGERGYLNPDLILKALASTSAADVAAECRTLRTGVFGEDKKEF